MASKIFLNVCDMYSDFIMLNWPGWFVTNATLYIGWSDVTVICVAMQSLCYGATWHTMWS